MSVIWALSVLALLVLCLIGAVVTLWQNLERAVERLEALEVLSGDNVIGRSDGEEKRPPDPRSVSPIPCALCGARFSSDQLATRTADGEWICRAHHQYPGGTS